MSDSPCSLDDIIASVVAAVRQAHAMGKHEALVSILHSAQAGLSSTSTMQASLFATSETASVSTSKRARSGPVKSVVKAFIFEAGKPVTEADFATQHPEINRSSRYMAFRGLAEAGEITKSGGAWVPTSKGVGNPGGETPGSEQQAGAA